jgi:uncharacterized membrane protein YidH (DUF202 family)
MFSPARRTRGRKPAGESMKAWLRWALVLTTVGGGFAGFAFALQEMFSGAGSSGLPNKIGMAALLLLYAGVTASGLLFVNDTRRKKVLMAALAIQVPWIFSSYVTYRFSAGLETVLGVTGFNRWEDLAFHWTLFLGSRSSFSILQEHPLGLGINGLATAIARAVGKIDPHVCRCTTGCLDSRKT